MDALRRGWSRVATERAVDIAAVVACLLLNVLAVKAQWSALPRPVIAVVGLAGSLAQWPRRRWPLFAAVSGSVSYIFSGNPGPLLVGVYSGATYTPRRYAWVVAIAGWAGLAGWSWLDEGELTLGSAIYASLGVALVIAVGLYMAASRALTASWRARAEGAEDERRLREEAARSAERTRIAREMHDLLAHKVSLIALHAGALELNATGSPARIQQGAALIRVTAREALHELRYVLGVLATEAGPAAEPDAASLTRFADLATLVRAAAQAGQQVELHDRVGPLPPATARVAYRVAQEGLTNARKYAPDAATTVAVDRDEDGSVTVTVNNVSTSRAPMDLPGSGSGLVGLAERVRLVGGAIHSGPRSIDAGGGWELRAVIPWLDHVIEERPEP